MSQQGSDYFFKSGGGGSSGSTGTGLKNYITTYKASTGSGTANPGNGDLEIGSTTGFVLGNVGSLTNGIPTSTSPTFGSGASGNLSIATANTSTLGGLFSLDLISSASTTLADCVSTSAFNIDAEDQGKVLTFKIAYKAQTNPTNGNWSGTSSNSYGVAVWDATNSVFLGTAGQFNFTQSSGIGYATGTFQTGITTASLRLIIYNVTASSGAITLRTDDWFCGPQVSVNTPAMKDWVSYTPTGSWSTNTTYTGQWRRVGDTLEGQVLVSLTGAPTSATLTINLPTGFTIDTTKFANSGGSQVIGYLTGASAGSSFLGVVRYNNTTSVSPLWDNPASQVSYTQNFPAAISGITQASPRTFANGDAVNIVFSVPIVSWSSNTVSSADTDTRVVAFEAQTTSPTATVTASFSLLKFGAGVLQDTHGAFSTSTGLYTCPVSGFYRVSSSVTIGATYVAANSSGIGIAKNGTVILSAAQVAGGVVGNLVPVISGTVYCNAGDTLAPYVISAGTTPVITGNTTYNWLTIERLSGPSIIQATESVNARYHSATATLTGSLSAITYTTKDFDTHNSYSGTTYTCSTTGKFQINASLVIAATFAATNVSTIAVFKNGSQYNASQTYAGGIQGDATVEIADIIQCNAGDTLVFQASSAGTGPTVVVTAFANYFSISRVGN